MMLQISLGHFRYPGTSGPLMLTPRLRSQQSALSVVFAFQPRRHLPDSRHGAAKGGASEKFGAMTRGALVFRESLVALVIGEELAGVVGLGR